MVGEKIISGKEGLLPYFKRQVDEAVLQQRVEVTEISKFYLVNLLNNFVKTDQLFDRKADRYEETPLALMLTNALKAPNSERVRIFKKMGDISLYISGYFSDHIDSKIIDIDYYISMGEGAYHNLSGILFNEKTFRELYGELSEKFTDLVCILSQIRAAGGTLTNAEILKLYERWLKTNDPSIKERLEKEGINLDNA